MTHSARRAALLLPLLWIVLGGLLPSLPGGVALAADAPPGWVARVVTQQGERYLTRDRLANAVLWRVSQDLLEKGSGPTTILRQLVQEKVVEVEAARLGVVVTETDIDSEYRVIDTRIRQMAGGGKNLQQVIVREQKSTVREFRKNLRHQILKERVASHQSYLGPLPADEKAKIAQIEVVIGELMERTPIAYGIPTALQETPTTLAPGVVALVGARAATPTSPAQAGTPITATELGEDMIIRLSVGRIHRIIKEECKAALTAGWALSPEQMATVLAEEKERWNDYREMTTQEAMRNVSYEDYVKMRYRLDLESLKKDRYFRGLYGLMRAMKTDISDETVRAEYEEKKTGIYGDGYLVTDVEIAFAPQRDLLGPASGRDRKQALQLANKFLRDLHAGVPFEALIRQINERRDPTFMARRLRVRNTDNGSLLYGQAKLLQDGQMSRPFETLAEVHVVRREKWLEAPTFDGVKDMIRDGMALQKTNEWLDNELTDPAKVEIRWPMEDVAPPTPR